MRKIALVVVLGVALIAVAESAVRWVGVEPAPAVVNAQPLPPPPGECTGGAGCKKLGAAPPGCSYTPCCAPNQQTCNAISTSGFPNQHMVDATWQEGKCRKQDGEPVVICQIWECAGTTCPNCWLDETTLEEKTRAKWKEYGPCAAATE